MESMSNNILKIRGIDDWGSGAFGSPRGDKDHRGVDICADPGEQVRSLTYGRVTKIGLAYPQSDRSHLRYVEVTLDGNRFRYFYVEPLVVVGYEIAPGDLLGIALDLQQTFNDPERGPMTRHIHFEIIRPDGSYQNPLTMFPGVFT